MLPTADTIYQMDITVPPVVHGPVLISYPDLNGFELGTKVDNPYQSLFERKPDAVISDAVAVYYGDFQLPDASALEYIVHGYSFEDRNNPQAALQAAKQAVALSPDNFDANRLLAYALIETGDPEAAKAPYHVALRRLHEMEPEVQNTITPYLEKKMADVVAKASRK